MSQVTAKRPNGEEVTIKISKWHVNRVSRYMPGCAMHKAILASPEYRRSHLLALRYLCEKTGQPFQYRDELDRLTEELK